MSAPPINVAVIGAGPVGLALALLLARELPQARVTLFDARAADADLSRDPRVLALALGSVQLLQRLRAWDAARAQPITEVHVSQQPPTLDSALLGGQAQVRLCAHEHGVVMLGAVQRYGDVVAPLQAAWLARTQAEPQRLFSRFDSPVAALKEAPDGNGVEVDAGVAERFDLALVAEGGLFEPEASAPAPGRSAARLRYDYEQTAWVGTVTLAGGPPGLAVERFTRQGPVALLPLRPAASGAAKRQAALVWCVASDDDPVRDFDAAQRLALLASLFPDLAGHLVGVGDLHSFALGLRAQTTLVRGRQVRLGNAAQTLHPVAGQGLNLGLRDAYALAHALHRAQLDGSSLDATLARIDWQRAPDRWGVIAATDFLARSFTWSGPGLPLARGLGLALIEHVPPLKAALVRRMMFGHR